MMQGLPDWMAVDQDDLTAIYIRKTTANVELIKTLVYPPSPYRYRQQARQQVAVGHLADAQVS